MAVDSKARAKAAAEDAPGAVACALAALRPVLEAESLLANALFLNGDVAGGLQEHERVLALDRDNPDSLYSHAGMLLDSKPDSVPALKTAQSELTRMLATSPQSSRSGSARKLLAWVDQAIAAGGTTALNKHRPAVRPPSAFASNAPAGAASRAPLPASALPADAPTALTPQMVEAVQNTEMTPEVVAGLGKLVEQGEEKLAHGQFQDALDAYKRVVPFQPENGRARAGMAWALVGLQRPMGDRIWSVAIQSDAGAMDKLGDTLLSKGDAAGARSLWKKLAQTAPDYASKAGLDKKVR